MSWIVPFGFIFLSTALLSAWALGGPQSPKNQVQERLIDLVKNRGVSQAPVVEDGEEEPGARSGKATRGPRTGGGWKQALFTRLDQLIASRAGAPRVALRLRRAGLRLQVSELIALQVGLPVMLGLLSYAVGRVFLVPVGIVVGIWLPGAYVNRRIQTRLKAFEGELPDTLSLMANSLKSGYSFLQAMELASREMPEPLASEFGQVMKEIRVNIAVEDALKNLTGRVPSDDLDLVVTAVLIQRQVGGNLAEVMDKIAGTIRERLRIMGEVKTLTAQGRISGWIVSLLPVGVGTLMYILNPAYMTPMLTRPLGWALLGVAVVMQVIGILIIRSIISLEV